MGIIEFSFAGQTQPQHEQGQGSVGADPHAVHVDTMEEGAPPLAPIPAPQRKPWFSLNLVDYTTLTIRLYYACRVPFYRWRHIVYSYFNLINNITISPSGVATNFFMDVNESEI